MSFDEQPDGDPHGECAAEIARLQAENERLRAEVLMLRSANIELAMYEGRPNSMNYMVACRCGWAGRVNELVHAEPVGDAKCCPKCHVSFERT